MPRRGDGQQFLLFLIPHLTLMVGWRFPPFSCGFVWRLKAHLPFVLYHKPLQNFHSLELEASPDDDWETRIEESLPRTVLV